MKREHAEQFSREVDGYRNALLYAARKSDWEAFKVKAGRLFDYVEQVECTELERRFFRTFSFILAVLVLAVLALLTVDYELHPEMLRFKNLSLLAALAASGFELYFYLDFRMYLEGKMSVYNKRRESFIRNVEQDFRCYTVRPNGSPS